MGDKMNYYQTNAVYKLLQGLEQHPFRWVSGNAWTLIYGDRNSVPLVLALVAGHSWTVQEEIKILIRRMAEATGLPWIEIYFDDRVAEIDAVELHLNGREHGNLSLADLKNELRLLGLPVNLGGTSKAINDASSSAYHNWQRANLGKITVSDIDLFRSKSEEFSAEIIELKRSFIPLQEWTPFRQDYPNFNLLHSVCRRCGIRMSIVYNVRAKNPFFDDARQLSIFDYRAFNTVAHIGIYSFEEFVSGNYL